MVNEPDSLSVRWSRVAVTRPVEEATVWVEALRLQGWPATALPLIDTGPLRDASMQADLQTKRRSWDRFDAIMFVSPASVQQFFIGEPLSTPLPDSSTRFWAPGPGTALALSHVLSHMGIDPSQIDSPPTTSGQFDSEHLWPVVQGQLAPGFRLLVVRGASRGADGQLLDGRVGSGRDWLMDRCRERGVIVDTCVAYERCPPVWDALQRADASACIGPSGLWLFSSSQALAHLGQLLPAADWSGTWALCTHDRIAETARSLGIGRVLTSRPALADVLRVLESVQSPS